MDANMEEKTTEQLKVIADVYAKTFDLRFNHSGPGLMCLTGAWDEYCKQAQSSGCLDLFRSKYVFLAPEGTVPCTTFKGVLCIIMKSTYDELVKLPFAVQLCEKWLKHDTKPCLVPVDIALSVEPIIYLGFIMVEYTEGEFMSFYDYEQFVATIGK